MVRVIEGFMIVPDTFAMRFFPKMVARHHDQDEAGLDVLRTAFLTRVLQAATLISITVPVMLWVLYDLLATPDMGLDLSLSDGFLVLAATFLMILRVTLSREIILTGFLFLSIVSYLSGAAFSYAAYCLGGASDASDAFLGYFVFALMSFLSPLLFSAGSLRPFYQSWGRIIEQGFLK